MPDIIPDARYVTVPIVKGTTDQPRDEREAVSFKTVRLAESEVLRICNRSLVLAVGGPPNSGKSTFTASLMVEINAILDSLQSRGGPWADLPYRCIIETLDAATPVSDAVVAGKGRDKMLLQNRKVAWTPQLARETAERVRTKSLERPQLVLADLPGKIDLLTKTLVTVADAAIIVTRDWRQVEEWRNLFEEASTSVPIVGEFKSNLKIPSMITGLDRGRIIRGKIQKPDRVVANWDPTVRTTAEFLLFDFLPTIFADPNPAT